MISITANPSVIGRIAIIVHDGQCYKAMVIDKVSGTDQPKRVRVLNDIGIQGLVLMPGQYKFKDWSDDED